MLINKDCKLAVVHPNKEFITRLSLYFPFHSKVLHNIKNFFFPNRQETTSSSSSTSSKVWENTLAMKKAIQCSELLPLHNTSKTLRNSFSGQSATPSQEEDLLNFRKVGQADFDTYVQNVYLGSSSVPMKTKSHKLKTFAMTKVTKSWLTSCIGKGTWSPSVLKVGCCGLKCMMVMCLFKNNIWNSHVH